MKINSISPEKSDFLQRLTTIDDYPKRLYSLGNVPKEKLPAVAVIGSRKPTSYGQEVAEKIAYELASAGVVIVSGLAYGIDSIAHRAALDAGGKTIAVLGNGLDIIYPPSHKTLAKHIIEQDGAIVSEYDAGTPAMRHHFLERNRIVSGMSDAVIVVEAASRSGTLSTAAHALNQGRDIFAVPGNITSPLSSGCNALIRQGATPLTDASDVLDVIAPKRLQQQTAIFLGDTTEETAILTLLQNGIRDGELLFEQSKLEPAVFNQTLSMLEIKGIIKPLGANQWRLSH